MPVRIEFYGIPRQRAGVDSVEVDATSVAAALEVLDNRMPGFARACLSHGRLRAGYVANLNGRRFLSDLHTRLHDGDALLILSTDAGG